MQKDITIDGVSFMKDWAWSKTEQQFVDEFKGMDHIFPEATDKAGKLKEAYSIIQKEKPKPIEPAKPNLLEAVK